MSEIKHRRKGEADPKNVLQKQEEQTSPKDDQSDDVELRKAILFFQLSLLAIFLWVMGLFIIPALKRRGLLFWSVP